MKCKICDTEYKSNYMRRVTCSDTCKIENKRRNKAVSGYKGLAVDTQNPLIIWKNKFIFR